MDTIALILAALLGATISGIVGMAGGVTLLGIMSALLPASQVVPLHGIIQLISNSTRTIVFVRKVRWNIFLSYVIPLTLGIWLGAELWSGQLGWFKPIIGVFIIIFLVSRRYVGQLRNLPLWSFVPLGGVVGILTLYVGATGPLIAPFFLRDDMVKEQVIATKAACQTWGHLLKVPAFLSLGFDYQPHISLLIGMSAAVIVGTLFGKRILSKFSKKAFTLAYQIVLALIATYLIIAGWLA
jgi:uncharacterized protein